MEGFGGFFNDPELQRQMAEMFQQMQGAHAATFAKYPKKDIGLGIGTPNTD